MGRERKIDWLRVGLTGGMASGKSTVARMLAEAGYPVLDTDQVGHELLEQRGGDVYRAVVARFGDAVLRADGAIDRSLLAAQVFGDREARNELERILHPAIEYGVLKRVAWLPSEGRHAVVLEVPLLFEAGWDEWVDVTVSVHCPVALQEERFMARTGATLEETRARLASQMTSDEKAARADFVVENNGDLAALRRAVDALVLWLEQKEREK